MPLKPTFQFSNICCFCSIFALAWGADDPSSGFGDSGGFENEEDGFDSFLAMEAPPPEQVITHRNIIKRQSNLFLDLQFQVSRNDSHDSDEAGSFNVVIRPREVDPNGVQPTPFIAPPPRPENTYIYNGIFLSKLCVFFMRQKLRNIMMSST